MKLTRRALVSGMIATSLASCSRSSKYRQRDRSTVTVRYIVDPERALGPAADTPARFLVFMPLVAWNRSGELEGRLADCWEHSLDFRSWRILLRERIRWHDGAPATGHDVKFTLDLLQHADTRLGKPAIQWRPRLVHGRALEVDA